MSDDHPVPNERTFRLWKVLASIACFAAASGLIRFSRNEVAQWGGGLFPSLCVIAAVVFAIAGVSLLLPKVGEFLLQLAAEMFQFFLP